MTLAALALAGFAGSAPTAAAWTRTTADLPDDLSGAQVHVVYAVPSNGADRHLDTNGTLAASTNNWESWMRGQTGGDQLRVDTFHGQPDITFVRLKETDAAIASHGLAARDFIEQELIARGLTKPDKIYAVYYDGTNANACGGGACPPALKGIVGALYVGATYGTGNWPCYVPADSLSGLHLMDLAIVHEILHTIGIVPTCAPHQTRGGHVSDSNTDLMWAGNAPWYPQVLDVGHDDYYDAHIPGCLDLTDSAYFDSAKSLTVGKSGTGSGSVASSPAGIDCGSTCSHTYAYGTSVTLTATARAGSRFAGWAGNCSGQTTCTLSLSAARKVGAAFNRGCVVPSVTGKTLAAARTAISGAGCATGTVTRVYSPKKRGTVVSQAPKAGAEVDAGTAVRLVVSKGRKR